MKLGGGTMEIVGETWRPILGYEGRYEVSDHGRVRSLDRPGYRGGIVLGRVLRQTIAGRGRGKYLVVDLYRGSRGTRKMARIHRLVAVAFLGEPSDPNLTDCAHIDGNSLDNRASNLKWATHGENLADRIAHGTHPETSKTHCPRGHALIAGNLAAYPLRTKGHRICLTCKRESSREARHAAKMKLTTSG